MRAIYVSPDDRMTPDTERAILAHDRAVLAVCGSR